MLARGVGVREVNQSPWTPRLAAVLLAIACHATSEGDGGTPATHTAEAGAAGSEVDAVGGGGSASGAGGMAGKASGPVIFGGAPGAGGTEIIEPLCPASKTELGPEALPAGCSQSYLERVPEGQALDPEKVNVLLHTADDERDYDVGWVSGPEECTDCPQWYFSDDYEITLCPRSCDLLIDHHGGIFAIQFGCIRRVCL